MESLSLESYEPSIASKIAVLAEDGGVVSLGELEAVYRDAKKLLFDYEGALEKCSRYAELYPELPVAAHRRTFASLVSRLHAAALQRRAELLKTQVTTARQELLRRQSAPDERHAAPPADALAREISDSLRQMSQSMQDEIARSEASYQLLQRSTRRLEATGETFGAFGAVVSESRRLIGRLWSRERTDRFLIGTALALYLLVLLYVASQRLWLPALLLSWAAGVLGGVRQWCGWLLELAAGRAGSSDPRAAPSSAVRDAATAVLSVLGPVPVPDYAPDHADL